MTRITRCRNCLGHVLSTLVTCPHCDRPARKRSGRIFTRGTVIFVLVALVAWTGIDTAIILHDRQQQERRRAAERGVAELLSLALCAERPDSLPAILVSSVEEGRSAHPGLLPAEFVETVVLRRLDRRTHRHVAGKTRGVVTSSSSSYEFAALAHRGGCWLEIRGRLGSDDQRLCCLEVKSIQSMGPERPSWSARSGEGERFDLYRR